MIVVPDRLRHSVTGDAGGQEWLRALPDLVRRAAQRWQLSIGEPFGDGMAAWTAPVRGPGGTSAVLKISYPHSEARHEAAALRVWDGHGAVRVLDAHEDDWALLLPHCRPGTALRDAGVDPGTHLRIGAALLARMATAQVPQHAPFPRLSEVASALADLAGERLERLAGQAPIPMDRGLLVHVVDLLRTLPHEAPRQGLAHGDLNPGNILRDDSGEVAGWSAIDPKAVVGDLAWDPWPLLTQIGDWTQTTPSGQVLAERTRMLADLSGLDAARVAAWATARSGECALWAANRGWWSGPRGADGDLARAGAWARAAAVLG